VALGRIGYDAVLRVYQGLPGFASRAALLPRFAHAAVVPLAAGPDAGRLPTVVTSYHHSRQNTQTGRLTPEMFDRVWTTVRELVAR